MGLETRQHRVAARRPMRHVDAGRTREQEPGIDRARDHGEPRIGGRAVRRAALGAGGDEARPRILGQKPRQERSDGRA